MVVYKRDTAFNELFVKPIRGLYIDQSIGVDEMKEKTLPSCETVGLTHDTARQVRKFMNFTTQK